MLTCADMQISAGCAGKMKIAGLTSEMDRVVTERQGVQFDQCEAVLEETHIIVINANVLLCHPYLNRIF